MEIYQIVDGLKYGDATGNFVIAISQVLDELGVTNFIYTPEADKEIDKSIKPVDAPLFLKATDANTLTGILAFQVIEHLTQSYLKNFFELAHRKITLNGIIIFETTNLKCSFALSNFCLSPTHIRPFPPKLLKLLL